MPTLGGARVALLEARMSKELADLVERFGGRPCSVPSVREARLPPLEHVAAFIAALCAGRFSAVVLLTGVGVTALLREADEAIRGNLQGKASAVVQRYGELGLSPRPMFDLLLRYAVSEDGALHAEKFYRTVSEEFAATRARFRWRHVVALARVTASEYGRPAAGMSEARAMLKV